MPALVDALSVTLPIRPMDITLRTNSRCPPLLVRILVPSPNLHIPGYSLVVSDTVLVAYHALVCFEHAAEYHTRHLYVATGCKSLKKGARREVRDLRFKLNSKSLVYRRERIRDAACHGEESTPLYPQS
jgi:hypothetical protein